MIVVKEKKISVNTCKICGLEYELKVGNHYISRDPGRTGVISALAGGQEEVLYDTFDCPHCGCQNVVQERKRFLDTSLLKAYDDEDYEDDGYEDDNDESDDSEEPPSCCCKCKSDNNKYNDDCK